MCSLPSTMQNVGHGVVKHMPLDSRTMDTCSLEWQITLLFLEIWWMSLGLAVARTVLAIVPNEKFGGSELMVLGSFAKVVLDPLIPVKGTLQHTKTFRTISCSYLLGKVWGWAFVIPTWLCTSAQSRLHKDYWLWVSEFDLEELDWPTQSPDLNPIDYLWDELEWRL